MKDAKKCLRNIIHKPEEDCCFKQLQCFQNISAEEWYQLIALQSSNRLGNRDE